VSILVCFLVNFFVLLRQILSTHKDVRGCIDHGGYPNTPYEQSEPAATHRLGFPYLLLGKIAVPRRRLGKLGALHLSSGIGKNADAVGATFLRQARLGCFHLIL